MQSVTKISKGEEITHSYTEPLDPVMTRKSILDLGKFFQVSLLFLANSKIYIINTQ